MNLVIRCAALGLIIAASSADAQTPANPPPAVGVPKTAAERTYYPKTDIYAPEDVLGRWVFYNSGQLEWLSATRDKKSMNMRLQVLPDSKILDHS